MLSKNSKREVPNSKIGCDSLDEEFKYEQRHQFIISTSLAISYIVLVYIAKEYKLTIYNVSALLNAAIQTCFWVSFLIIILSCRELYHIRILRRKSSFAKFLFLPYQCKEDLHQPMGSVSALIGLRGSNVERFVSMLIYLQLGAQFIVLFRNITNTDKYLCTNILGTIGTTGYWFILTYSIEHDMRADIVHYLGVIAAFGGSFGAFTIQQNYSLLSLEIAATALLNCSLCAIIASIKCKKENVYYQSISMLLLESNVIILSAIVGSLYTWNLTDD